MKLYTFSFEFSWNSFLSAMHLAQRVVGNCNWGNKYDFLQEYGKTVEEWCYEEILTHDLPHNGRLHWRAFERGSAGIPLQSCRWVKTNSSVSYVDFKWFMINKLGDLVTFVYRVNPTTGNATRETLLCDWDSNYTASHWGTRIVQINL